MPETIETVVGKEEAIRSQKSPKTLAQQEKRTKEKEDQVNISHRAIKVFIADKLLSCRLIYLV